MVFACLGLWVAGNLTSALILTKEDCLKSLLLQMIVSYLHCTVRTKREFFLTAPFSVSLVLPTPSIFSVVQSLIHLVASGFILIFFNVFTSE